MSIENNHAAFDPVEQSIMASLNPADDGPNGPAPDLAPEPGDGSATPPASAPAPAPAAPVPAPAPAPAPAPEANQGDKSAALRASRHAEKRARQDAEEANARAAALEAQLAELKKTGTAPVSTEITDEELAELEEDFPLQAKVVRRQREIEAQLAARPPVATPTQQQAAPEFQPVSYDPSVQEVIDSVPDLLAWQYDPASQAKFQRAVQYDKALSQDPDWMEKPIAERFAEAARRTAQAMGSSTPSPAPAPAGAPRLDPAAVIAAAQLNTPKGISDFRGGATGTPPTVNYAGMSDEAIMASLPAG